MNPIKPLLQKKITGVVIALITVTQLIASPINQVKANPNIELTSSTGFDDQEKTGINQLEYANQIDYLNQEFFFSEEFGIKSKFSDPEILQKIDGNRIETFIINMPQLDDRERTVIVYLPSDYETGNSAYPVIYLQDAQDVFFLGNDSEWVVNKFLFDFYTTETNSEAIIIGVKYDFIHIWDEYSPWVNQNMYLWMDPYDSNRVQGGEGDAYLAFLIDTLKPEIDNRYRTLPDRENTAIGGYKMGGLFSIYVGLTRSDYFSKVMAMSPSVWFAEDGGTWLSRNRLLALINSSELPLDVTFLIDVADTERSTAVDVRPAVNDAHGSKISFPQAYLEGARVVVEALLEKGLPNTNINRGNFDLDAWSEPIVFPSSLERTSTNTYFFSLFMKQGLDYFDIYIPFQNRYRRVWVSLPPDYFRDSKEYPVLYLFDAQHTFGSETGAYVSDSKDWLFDEKLKDIFYQTGTGIIGVALEYDYSHPWDEFMPWDNKHMDNWLNDVPAVCPGNADLLLDFIVTILKPFIDDRYRTLEDRDNTGIGGGSRSALISLYAGLSHPETFSKVMALSPAVWLTEENSKPYLSGNNLKQWFRDYIVPKNVLFFLYIGGNENSGPPFPYPFAYAKDGTKLTMPQVYYLGADMVRKEMLTNLGDSSTFKFVYNINGTHFPYFWRRYIFDALNWLGFY